MKLLKQTERQPLNTPVIEMRKGSNGFWRIIIVGFIILLILFFVIKLK